VKSQEGAVFGATATSFVSFKVATLRVDFVIFIIITTILASGTEFGILVLHVILLRDFCDNHVFVRLEFKLKSCLQIFGPDIGKDSLVKALHQKQHFLPKLLQLFIWLESM
jgi:hypothetical protein